MWFWIGSDLGTFIFPGYIVTTIWSFSSTCIALAALALLYEGMKIIQIKLHYKTREAFIHRIRDSSDDSSLLTRVHSRFFLQSYKYKNALSVIKKCPYYDISVQAGTTGQFK